MFVDFGGKLAGVKKLGIAVSGGIDSMALLRYTVDNSADLGISVFVVNVEHGIRGENSVADSLFVKNYCNAQNIPLISYSVNAPEYAKEHKLSIEEGARVLRYECFYRAISEGKCDKIATAHHLSDNLESVLINLFRGTGIKGLSGIKDSADGLIIRPMAGVSKSEIQAYAEEKNLPFVSDETNFCDDYTRNYLRLNVIPKIKEIFPEAEKTVFRLSLTAGKESDYLDKLAESLVSIENGRVQILLSADEVLIRRAAIIALKKAGIKKDYGKAHIDALVGLSQNENGKRINLLNGVSAYREYGRIVFDFNATTENAELPFSLGEKIFGKYTVSAEKMQSVPDLKNGFYADLKKIGENAVIRTRKEGDRFIKFGGGEKSLGDFLTDKKIPLRLRDGLPLLADGDKILAIFGLAISDLIKVDKTTDNIIKLTCKEN